MEQMITLQECTGPICFLLCLLYLWKTRNDRIFNNRGATPAVIFQLIVGELKLWATRAHKDQVGNSRDRNNPSFFWVFLLFSGFSFFSSLVARPCRGCI
jgi:hypothetical protein